MASARKTQINSRHTIADTFVRLLRGVDEVTLQCEKSCTRYPVSIISVDRAVGQCRLEITDLADVNCALAQGRPFVLHIRQVGGTMTTSPMQSKAIEPGNRASLQLRCELPTALTLSRHRVDFRATPTQKMLVNAVLRAYDKTEYAGRLCNLSVSGCLVHLPDVDTRALAARNGFCHLGVHFPSGDVLEIDGYVRRLYRPSGRTYIYAGIRFEAGLDYSRMGTWFYVREIQREVARRTQARGRLRALATSALFTGGRMAESRTKPEPAIPVH